MMSMAAVVLVSFERGFSVDERVRDCLIGSGHGVNGEFTSRNGCEIPWGTVRLQH
jgi:hypothetical protein